MNARFWIYVNDGWAKLTLRPGEHLYHRTGGATEEGWFREHTTWEHNGDHVERETWSRQRDCDGLWSDGGTCRVSLNKLAEVAPYHDEDSGIRFPEWENADSWQRDHSAEAAGY